MNEINKINLSEQTKFRLSEIIRIGNCFHQEINQRKSCSKKLSKYVTAFDYIDKILIVLSATSSGVSIISFTSIIGAPTKFRLSEIIGIENYFYQEINQRKSCSKKLNKYVTTFDYIDKILIVLSATSSGVSIISFTSIVGAPVGIASASFTLIFSL